MVEGVPDRQVACRAADHQTETCACLQFFASCRYLHGAAGNGQGVARFDVKHRRPRQPVVGRAAFDAISWSAVEWLSRTPYTAPLNLNGAVSNGIMHSPVLKRLPLPSNSY